MLEEQSQEAEDEHQNQGSENEGLGITIEGKDVLLRAEILEDHAERGREEQ